MAICILNQVQIFDEPVADESLSVKERLNLPECIAIKLAAARKLPGFPLPRLRNDAVRPFCHAFYSPQCVRDDLLSPLTYNIPENPHSLPHPCSLSIARKIRQPSALQPAH
jgi:hypothetical protein